MDANEFSKKLLDEAMRLVKEDRYAQNNWKAVKYITDLPTHVAATYMCVAAFDIYKLGCEWRTVALAHDPDWDSCQRPPDKLEWEE